MPPNTVPVQSVLSSHLKVRRLTDELASAQKKVDAYEDLFATLYQNACEHCKGTFQRIGVAGTGPESSLAARTSVEMPSASDGNGLTPHASSPSTKPLWNRILKRPRISLPKYFSGRRASTTSHVSAGSSQVSTTSPHDDSSIQAQYFVKFHDSTDRRFTLQVKLECVWTHTSVYSVKFSPNGKLLAVGVADYFMDSQKTYIYDATPGEIICLLADRYARRGVSSSFYLSFSPGEGNCLATGHSTGRTMIWQVGKKHVRNAVGAQENSCIDFSPDGRFIVSGSFNRSGVRIWSMRDGSSTPLQDPDGEGSEYIAVKFSPDGKYVVASDLHGMLRLWDIRTSKLVRKWKAHQQTVWSVVFTANGRGLVTASDDHTLKYWDLGPGYDDIGEVDVEVLKFVGHSDAVRSVAISSDGRWVVSGSYDCTARIWDIADATLQCTFLGHEKGVMSVDFSPTGNCVVFASRDGKVSLWSYQSSSN